MDISIKTLQEKLPWGLPYSTAFEESTMTHKHFQHALMHVLKSAGILAALVEKSDHITDTNNYIALWFQDRQDISHRICDLIMCATRMANTIPHLEIDLQDELVKRICAVNKLDAWPLAAFPADTDWPDSSPGQGHIDEIVNAELVGLRMRLQEREEDVKKLQEALDDGYRIYVTVDGQLKDREKEIKILQDHLEELRQGIEDNKKLKQSLGDSLTLDLNNLRDDNTRLGMIIEDLKKSVDFHAENALRAHTIIADKEATIKKIGFKYLLVQDFVEAITKAEKIAP